MDKQITKNGINGVVPTKIEMNEVFSVDIKPQMSTLDADKKEGK